jgi:hypothetical protein
MEEAAARWRYDERHKERSFHDGTFPKDITKWSETRSEKHPYHYMDGVTILVAETDLYPDDDFLGPINPADSPL